MQSWSFKLRNKFITSAPGFKYGDELEITGRLIEDAPCGGCTEDDLIFRNRVRTFAPENGEIKLSAESDTWVMI